MHYSSDTGEVILNNIEQAHADIAEDDLNSIALIMGEFWGLIEVLRGKIQTRGLMEKTEADLNYLAEGMQERLREFLGNDWSRLTAGAHLNGWVHSVPEKNYSTKALTNPNTLKTIGKLD